MPSGSIEHREGPVTPMYHMQVMNRLQKTWWTHSRTKSFVFWKRTQVTTQPRRASQHIPPHPTTHIYILRTHTYAHTRVHMQTNHTHTPTHPPHTHRDTHTQRHTHNTHTHTITHTGAKHACQSSEHTKRCTTIGQHNKENQIISTKHLNPHKHGFLFHIG